jgi:hypothetical protein
MKGSRPGASAAYAWYLEESLYIPDIRDAGIQQVIYIGSRKVNSSLASIKVCAVRGHKFRKSIWKDSSSAMLRDRWPKRHLLDVMFGLLE